MTKILVVEDDEINRKLLVELLQYFGYDTITACNGAEAIEIAKEKRPELILMDIQMPVMDGLTALKILKNDIDTKDIKVLVLSALAFSDDVNKAMLLGAEDYITKPFDTRKLPEILKKYLQKEE